MDPGLANTAHEIIHKHGGRYLARSANVKTLEGKPLDTTLIALLQFPNEEAALAFASDPAYAPYARMRKAGSDSRFQLIDDTDAAGTIVSQADGIPIHTGCGGFAARAVAAAAANDDRPIGPLQLQAGGNVQIDGQAPGQGAFRAQADRATYEQAKETFRLEGDGRTPAMLWRAGQQGAPYQARKIHYNHVTGEVKVEGIQFFEITPGDLER